MPAEDETVTLVFAKDMQQFTDHLLKGAIPENARLVDYAFNIEDCTPEKSTAMFLPNWEENKKYTPDMLGDLKQQGFLP